MKKLITLSFLAIITSLLFSACSTKLFITKRHYTKGFYIAHSKEKKQAIKFNEAEKIITKNKVSEFHNQTQEMVIDHNYGKSPIPVVCTYANENKKIPIETSLQQTEKKTSSNKILDLKQSIKQFKNEQFKSKFPTASRSGDGLSLFWIVILVILILWALGLLSGGFGGLINLLLLIALILLILWLLRVI